MESWADRRRGCPECVTEALQYVRWSPVLLAVGADEELGGGDGAPVEYQMSIQLGGQSKEGGVPRRLDRRASGVKEALPWSSLLEQPLLGDVTRAAQRV